MEKSAINRLTILTKSSSKCESVSNARTLLRAVKSSRLRLFLSNTKAFTTTTTSLTIARLITTNTTKLRLTTTEALTSTNLEVKRLHYIYIARRFVTILAYAI